MKQHTPGPWYVEKDPDKRTGTRIRTASIKIPNAPHGLQVARVITGMGWDRDAANAALIAAAPELLEALERIIADWHAKREVLHCSIIKARSAIAKATRQEGGAK